MADNSRLISGGINYFIEGGGKYTGSGTPWTVVTTSPYEIAMNDTAGTAYTPQAATRQEVYGGGPPFRNGQTLIYDSYGNVTESVTIQCRANSHDNAVFLLRQLRQILNTALFSTPCVLAYQPNGATNAVYFEIYGADVQEDARFVNSEAGAAAAGNALVRAVVTWRRSPHGGVVSTGETVLNGVSFANTGTGSPDNVEAYSTGSGDMIYEGSPLNIKALFTSSGNNVFEVYVASVASRTYSTTGAATYNSVPTSGTTASLGTFNLTNFATSAGLKPRILMHVTSQTGTSEYRVLVYPAGASSGLILYTSPWIRPFYNNNLFIDFGTFPTNIFRRSPYLAAPQVAVTLEMRSITGTTNIVVTSVQFLRYYTFAYIDAQGTRSIPNNNTHYLLLETFSEVTGYPCLPHPTPLAVSAPSSGNAMYTQQIIRGRLPRYYSGASLWIACTLDLLAYTTTTTYTVTATHAPLYKTLRGGG